MGNVIPLRPTKMRQRSGFPYAGLPMRNDALKGSKLNCPEYQKVYNAMTVKPTAIDRINQNKMMMALVDRGYYDKAEFIDIFCTHSGGQNVNWKNPGTFTPEPINSPNYEAYKGYTGDSANVRYVKLHFNPSTNASLITNSNYCLIYGVANDVKENKWDVGVYDGSISFSALSRDSGDAANFIFHNTGATAFANTNSMGHYGMSLGNNTFSIYRNVYNTGSSIGSYNNLINKEMYACGRNQNGTPNPCNRTISYVMLFSYLKPYEVEEVMVIMEQYLRLYNNGLNTLKLIVPQIDTFTNLHLNTYVTSDGSTVHPSVISENLSGYKYWQVNTPYTNNNNQYENPSIWASNDGNEWVIPDGLTNPIVPTPSGGFNNDPDIISDGGKLYVFWNEKGVLKQISSSDGITWGNKQGVTIEGTWIGTSPSLIKIGNDYYLYYIEFSSPNGVLKRQKALNIEGPYASAETITLETSGYWHFEIIKIGNIYWLPMKNNSVDGLQLFYSSDALNFTKCVRPLIRYSSTEIAGTEYRPTICEIGNRIVLYTPLLINNEFFTHRMDLTILD